MLAFEVLEHLPNPMEVIKEIMDKTDCFIFSTETLKKFDFNSNKEWWYFVPGSGQHIFLSSETTLKKVAELLSCRYDYIKGLHILHRGHNFKKIGVFAKIKILALLLTEKIYQLILRSNKFKAKTWDDHLFMTSVLNDKQKENTSAPN